MRIKIEGRVTSERVMEVMNDLLARSPQGADFTELNLYFTIRDGEIPVEFLNDEGEVVEFITYREERKQVPLKRHYQHRAKKKPQLRVVNNEAAENQSVA